ncbi:pseudouridylate synthase TRUB1 isoform X4 [Rhipicephalus microplus]|uniref:pseudouridylate synthase TRUB1 isoform X4 n=1 Tax=Rhipicephalus microplus TaxID=6941 RepID=UPI003F6B7295
MRARKLHLNIRLNTYGINVYPIGHLETFARGVIGYNVGTRDSISRWLRLSNRKFVVKGCFGTDTCSYNSLGRVVETAPYDHISEEKLLQVFPQFLGEIKQAVSLPEAPPRDAEMVAKRDHVAVMKHLAICHSIRCTELSLPHFSLDILCGPGFSPRVFVHDLGKETSIIQAALSCDRKLVYAVNNFPLEGHYCITRRRPSRSLRRRPSRFLPSFFTTTRAVAIRSRAAARMLFLKLRTKGKE